MPDDEKPSVFISYRRSDTKAIARLIHQGLVAAFGREQIFFDIDSVPVGADFVDYLTAQVAQCSVLLAIVGDRWTSATDAFGEADFVRIEVRAALQLGLPVIPIFADGAHPPRPESLPDDIRPLLRRNGLSVDSGRDFANHMEAVVRHARRVSDEHRRAIRLRGQQQRLDQQEGARAASISSDFSVPPTEAQRGAVSSGSPPLPPERTQPWKPPFLATALGGTAIVVLLVTTVMLLTPKVGALNVSVVDTTGTQIRKASVALDGMTRCSSSPCGLSDLAAGVHLLKVSAKGYSDVAPRAVRVDARQQASSTVALSPLPASLQIAGPPNLKVTVDDKARGVLPTDVTDLAPGAHRVRIDGGDRYDSFDRSVSLEPGSITPLKVELKVVKGLATIVAGSNADGAYVVLVDGGIRRPIPHLPIRVDIPVNPEHKYGIVATKPGFDDFTQSIEFEKGNAERTFVINLVRSASLPSAASNNAAVAKERLTPEDIRQIVSNNSDALKRRCWQPALLNRTDDAPPAARVMVHVTIAASGSVEKTVTEGEAPRYPGLAECVGREIAGWRFGRATTATDVSIPFVFAAN
jgi:hypothetical protein